MLAASLATLSDQVRGTTAAARRAGKAASRFRVVASITLPSRFVPRVEGKPGPFDRPLSAVGLFDRTSAADRAEIAGMERFVAMLTRVFGAPRTPGEAATFQFRATGGFDRPPSRAFDFRATGGFDRTTPVSLAIRRVELRLIDLASRLRVGF